MNTEKQRELYQELYTALRMCMACSPSDFRQELEEALAQGFPINFQGEDGWTLLMNSMWRSTWVNEGKAGVPRILLEYGADPNVANADGSLPLARAVYWKRPAELIENLIRAGAGVDAQDKWGRTAFDRAAKHYIYDYNEEDRDYGLAAAQLLLEYGADPFLCSSWLKEGKEDMDDIRASRNEIRTLCEAYKVKRDAARLYETERDLDGLVR